MMEAHLSLRTSLVWHLKILLPNTDLTNTNSRDGILFLPSADQLFMDGGDATSEKSKGANEESLPQGKRVSLVSSTSSRTTRVEASAIIKAHEHIGMLQRWCKKQDEVIKKLTETVNSQGEALLCITKSNQRPHHQAKPWSQR
ncbi:unnamed protein product [Microthlaspi erraticum]|uniref:Arabidopsis retrotransposon Orf1 C-terminal domain-containing protein n=1 Tax=Microthlaspi erraticum TaxID=1685480 RepID=A0A6D2KZ75_9BRAS|nr:unnamed protein product [Microthlaspi erraticum]